MRTFLKVKIHTLASEAKYIKGLERKWKKAPREGTLDPHPMFFSLQTHRRHVVRPACRSAHLAYGFLRGRAYRKIENKCHEPPNWKEVANLIGKFSDLHRDVLSPAPRYLAIQGLVKAWSEVIPNE